MGKRYKYHPVRIKTTVYINGHEWESEQTWCTLTSRNGNKESTDGGPMYHVKKVARMLIGFPLNVDLRKCPQRKEKADGQD